MSRPTQHLDAAPDLISIGDASRRSGKATSAIRYYEEVGLLPAAQRVSGRRRYPPEIVRTLAIIETAQRAGLNLLEIRWLFEASPSDPAATERLREVADRKLPELRESIRRAQLVQGWLEDAARCCCPTLEDCPLFAEADRLPERGGRRAPRPKGAPVAGPSPGARGRSETFPGDGRADSGSGARRGSRHWPLSVASVW
jgi:MerR family redox-sensitive transcriptional activator SoxR